MWYRIAEIFPKLRNSVRNYKQNVKDIKIYEIDISLTCFNNYRDKKCENKKNFKIINHSVDLIIHKGELWKVFSNSKETKKDILHKKF